MRARWRQSARRMKRRAAKLGLPAKNADHLAACSCPMCGNPRRHFGKRTAQERRAVE